jgi:hypothetical protein
MVISAFGLARYSSERSITQSLIEGRRVGNKNDHFRHNPGPEYESKMAQETTGISVIPATLSGRLGMQGGLRQITTRRESYRTFCENAMAELTEVSVVTELRKQLALNGFAAADIEEICDGFELLGESGAFKVTSSRLDLIANVRVDRAIQRAIEIIQAA